MPDDTTRQQDKGPKCPECYGTGRTDNHVTGEVECGNCEGSGDEAYRLLREENDDKDIEIRNLKHSLDGQVKDCLGMIEFAQKQKAMIERMKKALEKIERQILGNEGLPCKDTAEFYRGYNAVVRDHRAIAEEALREGEK